MNNRNRQQFLADLKKITATTMFGERNTEMMQRFKLQKTGQLSRLYSASYAFAINELTLISDFNETAVNMFPSIVEELVHMTQDNILEMPELKTFKVYLYSQEKINKLVTDAKQVIIGLKADPRYMNYINSHEMVDTQEGLLHANIILYLRADIYAVPKAHEGYDKSQQELFAAYSIGTFMVMALNGEDALATPQTEWTRIRDTLDEDRN